MIPALNEAFGIGGDVVFDNGRGGLVRARIANSLGSAEVYLHGAQVTAFRPTGGDDVLWTSPLAVYESGRAIRGGIPVVWPWFGPHPHDPGKPQHGFARTRSWTVVASERTPRGGSALRLTLRDDDVARALWPHPFALDLHVAVEESLTVSLAMVNHGGDTVTFGAALHTYLRVGDVAGVCVEGLEGCEYIDKLDRARVKEQCGPVTIDGEVDRVYLNTSGACVVRDAAGARRIRLTQLGSRATVVWNPWREKARAMADCPDAGYVNMLCVEAVNAGRDVVRVPPGGAHVLSQSIAVEPEEA